MTAQVKWTKVRDGAYRYNGSVYLAVRDDAYGYWRVFKGDEPVAGGSIVEDTRRLAGSRIAELIRQNVRRALIDGLDYFDGQTLDTIEYALLTMELPADEDGGSVAERRYMAVARDQLLGAIEAAR